MQSTMLSTSHLLLALSLAASPALSQTARGIARDDLARSLQRLELALLSSPPAGEARAELEASFDRATASFFMGSYGAALSGLDRMGAELDLAISGPPVLLPLELRTEPGPGPRQLSVEAVALYGELPTLEATLQLQDAADEVLATRPVSLDEGSWVLEVREGTKLDQDLWVSLQIDGRSGPRSQTSLAPELPPRRVRRLLAELTGQNADPLSSMILRSRCELLEDELSPMRSAEFLLAPHAFAGELEEEARALAAGELPYAGRRGSWWLSLEDVPMRIVAPEGEGPWPLVLAFHGMGGDENMFAEAYGAGHLAGLAKEHGFLLVCPSTYKVLRSQDELPRLLQLLGRLYPIDEERRYLVGHSMGAGLVASLLGRSPSRWSGALSIAGVAPSSPANGERLPTCVQVHGELDGIIPAAPVQRAAGRLQAAGQPLEFVLLENRGHTLVVPEALDLGLARLGLLGPEETSPGTSPR